MDERYQWKDNLNLIIILWECCVTQRRIVRLKEKDFRASRRRWHELITKWLAVESILGKEEKTG